MKLEVGMYVRTKRGIRKIDHINPRKTINMFYYKLNDDYEYGVFGLKDIIKASHNIIDLIEKGDYVNGEKVILKNDGYIEIGTTNDYIGFNNEEHVKSIVTKEQFESMSYKL